MTRLQWRSWAGMAASSPGATIQAQARHRARLEQAGPLRQGRAGSRRPLCDNASMLTIRLACYVFFCVGISYRGRSV
jgi:hypothetical protein